ncbi:MAG: hypothetical protein MPJ24_06910 [Pirellulaceae bacterium]|nr:hypothetical protein [Pirellulaceae bacterium]
MKDHLRNFHLLAIGVALVNIGVLETELYGQIRGVRLPVVKPKAVVKPKVSIPKTTSVSASKPRINGNSLASNRSQHMYGIFRTNKSSGRTSLYKVGISGGKIKKNHELPSSMRKPFSAGSRDYSVRGLSQVQKLNRAAEAKGKNIRYSTRILKKVDNTKGGTTTRKAILGYEKQAVTKYNLLRGTSPTGNKLPRSAKFSRIN